MARESYSAEMHAGQWNEVLVLKEKLGEGWLWRPRSSEAGRSDRKELGKC